MTNALTHTGRSSMPVEVATPQAGGERRPCVIMLHERYGYVQHTADMVAKLAAAGYVVLGPDLFFDDPDQESLKAGTAPLVELPDTVVSDRLHDCVELLAGIAEADPERLVIVGSCQSGRYPFVYAADHDLRGFVVFYGGDLANDWSERPEFPNLETYISRITCPVLGIYGEGDHVISVDHVRHLRDVFERNRRSYCIRIYPDAPHGWLNSTMPGRYRADLAEVAWQRALDFIDEVTTGEPAEASRVNWQFHSEISADYDFGKQTRRA